MSNVNTPWPFRLQEVKLVTATGAIKNSLNVWRSISYFNVTGIPEVTLVRVSTTTNSSGDLETTVTAFKEIPELDSVIQADLPMLSIVHIDQQRATEKSVSEYHCKVLKHFNFKH